LAAEHPPRSPSAPVPAIRGSALSHVVEHVRAVCRKRSIPTAEVEWRLGKAGTRLLSVEVLPTDWHPVSVYGALRQFLREVEGNGRDQYTVDSAAESARKILAGGLYPQFNFLKQIDHSAAAGDAKTRRDLFVQRVERLSTLYNSLFNFATTKVTDDPEHDDRVQLEYHDGGVMPHDGRLGVLGFWLEGGVYLTPSRCRNLWTKIDAEDHYILCMTRDISAI